MLYTFRTITQLAQPYGSACKDKILTPKELQRLFPSPQSEDNDDNGRKEKSDKVERSGDTPDSSDQEEQEEEKMKIVKDQATKPTLNAYPLTQFDMECAESGSFKVHRRTLRLLFSNIEKQVDASTLDPKILTAKGFLEICIQEFLGGYSNIDYAGNAKHFHQDKTTHYHQLDKLIKKVKTTDPRFFRAGGAQGHVIVSNSKHGWGLEGVFRYMWYVVSHLSGIAQIMDYLNDPVYFYFLFGEGSSIAGISDTDTLYEHFIGYWITEKQKEASRAALRRQSTLSISDSSTSTDKNKNKNKHKNKNKNKNEIENENKNQNENDKPFRKRKKSLSSVGDLKKAPTKVITAIMAGKPLNVIKQCDPEYFLKNYREIKSMWIGVKSTIKWKPSKGKELNELDPHYAKLNGASKAVVRVYSLKGVIHKHGKGLQAFLFSGPSGIGKTTCITKGMGCVLKIDELSYDGQGWSENAVPNDQDALFINGLRPDWKKHGFTISLFEKAGDLSPFLVPQRYLNEQCYFNSSSPITLFIDSNYRLKELFTADERLKVIDARINEIQGTEDMTFFGATDFIRRLNGKPPLRKEQDDIDELRALLNFQANEF